MDKRVWLLVLAGMVIAGLCAFRLTRPEVQQSIAANAPAVAAAPLFELYDQSKPSKVVRLISYVGRYPILVVFFDGRAGADHSDVLQQLRKEHERLRKAGVYTMAISAALPQENRKIIVAGGEFPFPLLSDPGYDVHRAWGRYDETGSRSREGVFLIDHRGLVAWSLATNSPQPLDNWKATVRNLEGE